MIEHVARVAEAVPSWARTTAWLHDLLELTPISAPELRARGMLTAECQALELLTRRELQPYAEHVARIAEAPGTAGQIARAVKLADLDDHLAHSLIPRDAPPYAWARRYLLAHSAEFPGHISARAG